MRAPLSVVIPTLNAADDLPDTLASLIPGLAAGLIREVVVVDAGSQDDTVRIAELAGAKVVHCTTGRGRQLREGAEIAAGDWLLFLHADTGLGAGWADKCAEHIAQSKDAAYFRLRYSATGIAPRIVETWVRLRSLVGLPYGDQGLLISRPLYEDVDGYDAIPLMEDVAIVRRLRGRLVGLPIRAQTSAAKYQTQGWVRRGGRNLVLLLRFLAGANPEVLAQKYDP